MSISVRNLTKVYGEQKAVDDISFDVNTGEILGFLGPNGAGKTTTMKILTCYMPPTMGSVQVDGLSIDEHSLEVRKKIGYLPEMNPLYHDMNVLDYLEYSAQLHGLRKGAVHHRIKEMVRVCGLESVRHKDIGEMSKGFRQRVGLAQAMIHDPEVLILDEPTSGLDPNQIVEIRNLIKELGQAKTLILSTHILSEVQATCDRVLIINEGKIVADGSPEKLQQEFHGAESL
ncbi:MAG: ATP-binding cassette domain-containing protein, partial [Bacteroidetes bacterium]|nr:ATP-binding cassette domain-containing protein [Bacteroidota bacterium]